MSETVGDHLRHVASADMPALVGEAEDIRKRYIEALKTTKKTLLNATRPLGRFGIVVQNVCTFFEMVGTAISETESKLAEKSQWLSDNGCCLPTTMSAGSSITCTYLICTATDVKEGLNAVLKDDVIISELIGECRDALSETGHILVFDQAIDAAKEDKFALACIGLFSILDLFYEQMTGMKSKDNNGRRNLEKKLRYRDMMKWPLERLIPLQQATTIGAISALYSSSRGVDAIYPGFATRNRVMHGHDLHMINIEDVVRVLLAIAACSGFRDKFQSLRS